MAISAPVGPIALLCIRRSILDGRLCGLVTGLAAATTDGLWGILALLGISALTKLLNSHEHLLHLAGGVFLIALGVHLIRSRRPRVERKPNHSPSLRAAYFSTFGLTLVNPVTIFAFVGIFSFLHIGSAESDGLLPTLTVIIGIFLGSSCWWLLLSGLANFIAGRVNFRILHLFNLVSGSTVLAFGVFELAQQALQMLAQLPI